MLPYYRWSLRLITTDFQLTNLSLLSREGQSQFVANFQVRRPRVIQGTLIPAGRQFNSSTLVGHALQHPILIFSPLLAWWMLTRRSLLRLLLGGVCALLCVELLDLPFVLIGSIEDLILVNVNTALPADSALVGWMNFLNGGGRMGLCLFAAASLLLYHPWPTRPRNQSKAKKPN
ncbi:MAG: hypothetical protein HY080_02915 [Gammaproteobacteria bacterium]|nr:hypothetical protein [Gammaproteobacteria bacterium]